MLCVVSCCELKALDNMEAFALLTLALSDTTFYHPSRRFRSRAFCCTRSSGVRASIVCLSVVYCSAAIKNGPEVVLLPTKPAGRMGHGGEKSCSCASAKYQYMSMARWLVVVFATALLFARADAGCADHKDDPSACTEAGCNYCSCACSTSKVHHITPAAVWSWTS